MASLTPPRDPLIVIFGSTGTGKSDLAVELASRFNGEIINSDAMQMYKGLPIITNKISQEERRGIPHHLLGNIGLEEETWVVGRFKREASRIIREIRGRGKLPIVVGGTHYYINGLLFENGLVEEQAGRNDGASDQEEDGKSRFPILDGSTEEILKKLREVDPVMADKWHPNDRRKISRSLEIYLTTGRRASDIYEEQKRQREEAEALSDSSSSPPNGAWQPLMFWVYSKPDVLNARLNRRIDKMLDAGLMTEVAEMHQYLQTRSSSPSASGSDLDRTKGIWQSIGFKEFEPYLGAAVSDGAADEKEPERLKQAGLERMKIATRQYAKYQVRWITHKTLPVVKQGGLLDRLFLLDSTDVSSWREEVCEKGVDVAGKFLAGEPLPEPLGLSRTAEDVLSSKMEDSSKVKTPCQKTCEVCRTTVVTEEAWQKHIKGRSHRRATHHAKRTALVPHPRPTALEVVDRSRSHSPEYLDLGLDFHLDSDT